MNINKKALLLYAFVFLSGCALFQWRHAEIYNMSYDQAYEVAMSALDDMQQWRLIQTDHKRGLLVIESGGYLRPERQVKIIVKRIEPFRTKVELFHKHPTPFTQKFFKAVDRRVEERALTYPS